jgi:hypothetical protein
LGLAAEAVHAEQLLSPWGLNPEAATSSSALGPLTRRYRLAAAWEGSAAEAILRLSDALGYGCRVEGRQAGRVAVIIRPAPQGAVLGELLRDLNAQLKPHGVSVGVDSINRVLSLRGGKVRP